MTEKNLFIIRGLPGSGKSAFIQAVAPEDTLVFNTDAVLTHPDGTYEWTPERHSNAKETMNEAIRSALVRGEPRIFLDGVFDEAEHFEPFIELAREKGYRVYTVVVENRHGGVSSHGVSEETLARFRANFDIQL